MSSTHGLELGLISAFRRESGPLASELIREAIAATRWYWPEVPELGMVTFIDTNKVRHKRDFGRCYVKAGFKRLKERTKGGLVVMQMLPPEMPEPMQPEAYGPLFATSKQEISGLGTHPIGSQYEDERRRQEMEVADVQPKR